MTNPWKLRFAPHIGLTSLDTPLFKSSVGSDDPVAQIEHIADLGFAGIEDNLLQLRSPADQERIGTALVRRGLEMGCFVGNVDAWNAPLWGRSDDEAQQKLSADLASAIATAARVGGKYLTTISGRHPSLPLWLQHQAMIENLKRMAPVAEKAGVVFGIEPTNEQGFPGMLVHHVSDAYGIVKAVDSPAVRLVFDAFHVQVMDGDLINNLERTFDAIGIVQIADNPGRLEPGTGEINFINLFCRLRALEYTGLVELEHAVSGDGVAGEDAALAALRAINDAI